MLQIPKSQICCVALMVALSSGSFLDAQQTKAQPTEAAPLPIQIVSAKKIFVSNASVEGSSLPTSQRREDPDRAYQEFYAAIKNWGRYELVNTPADADLVFEIRFASPVVGCEKICDYDPQFGLTIFDVKTHFTLWTLTQPIEHANRKATADKNFDQGMTNLVASLKKLMEQPDAATK